ncbi:MAG: CDP-alcohol phosphatidyltransferase family protein [bacterium]|nr:CDP-alcohol phosphatidyltransferase family protein [bacterium]
MIGFYNYTVILTFMSVVSAVLGMTFAHNGRIVEAMVCLALCGLFDALDGRVARRKTDRSNDEKLYGIQLDSLSDAIAFGAFPAYLCFCIGVRGSIGIVAIIFFAMCGVARLAYFNVLETNDFFSDDPPKEKVYHGLPITAIAPILPIFYLLHLIFAPRLFSLLLTALLFLIGILFISPFTLKKPKLWVLLVIIVVVVAALILLIISSGWMDGQLIIWGD